MIRIHLGAHGLGNVRIATTPDITAELGGAGLLQVQARPRESGVLSQLYSRSVIPDLGEEIQPKWFDELFAVRGSTPYTRALAEGDQGAHALLTRAIARLQTDVLEPLHPAISALVAARAAGWSQLAAAQGSAALLDGLAPGIRLRSGYLELPTIFDADYELGDRPLVIQPVAFEDRLTVQTCHEDTVAIRLPAGRPRPLAPAQRTALIALLGKAKAEVLRTIVEADGVTGRELAATLGVSEPMASRHAAVLRGGGLIRTHRAGRAVLHTATALGYQLVLETAIG